MKSEQPPGEVASPVEWTSRAKRWREWGLTALFVMLVFNVFVLPVIEPPGGPDILRDAFASLTLIIGIVAVANRRVITVVLVFLCAAAILARWIERFVPGSLLLPVQQAATLLALIVLGTAVGGSVFARGRITLDRVMGAIVLYLLIGVAFAVAYESVSIHVPGAFASTLENTERFSHWVYFSFVTLTTVGYGDITPVATIARSLATLEAFIGQLYPAVILARLVSLQIVPPTDKP